MTDDLHLRRKLSLRAHGQRLVLVKRPIESTQHVLMKAFLWALYLPDYPGLQVEVEIGGRYKPDLVALSPQQAPLFWGECGHVGRDKLRTLLARHRHTHFALARWGQGLHHLRALVDEALDGVKRSAPVDLLVFPDDAGERFITTDGLVTVRRGDFEGCTITGR